VQAEAAHPQSLVLGKALVRAAGALGLNQADLAEVLGSSKASVSRTFAGGRGLDPASAEGRHALLFVRLFEPARANPAETDDIRFVNYQPLSGTWIAARVEIWNQGKLVFSEDYSDIKANPKLDAALFDPKQFSPDRRP